MKQTVLYSQDKVERHYAAFGRDTLKKLSLYNNYSLHFLIQIKEDIIFISIQKVNNTHTHKKKIKKIQLPKHKCLMCLKTSVNYEENCHKSQFFFRRKSSKTNHLPYCVKVRNFLHRKKKLYRHTVYGEKYINKFFNTRQKPNEERKRQKDLMILHW